MADEIKITCLHDKHVALGALMSPFAGYDMPIQYSGIMNDAAARISMTSRTLWPVFRFLLRFMTGAS